VPHKISGNFAESVKVAISTLPDKYQSLDDYEGPDPRDNAVAATSTNVFLTCRVLEKNSNSECLVGVWQISKTQMLVEMFTTEQLTVRCEEGFMWVKSSRTTSKKAAVASPIGPSTSLESQLLPTAAVTGSDESPALLLNQQRQDSTPSKRVGEKSNSDTVDLTKDDEDVSAPGEDGAVFPVVVHHVGADQQGPRCCLQQDSIRAFSQ